MSAESKQKIIGVALGVCIVCSILVSTAAVSLNAIQQRNKKLDKIKNILQAGNLMDKGSNFKEIYDKYIEGAIINLETGEELPEDKYPEDLTVEEFDIKKVANDPELGKSIPSSSDIAQIKRMPKYMSVYFVREEGEIKEIILPIYGKGLWSTMYGFIALGSDLKTIEGFTFYEHGETPGLGGEVDNPSWKKSWQGKKAFGDDWNVKIEVLKGRVDPTSDKANYQIDGLSGSTLTTRGVDNLVKFWLGNNGYSPFLERLREESNYDKI
jgi:Na+-transporting NADH:ubiquinone oxidoreductase subunit C